MTKGTFIVVLALAATVVGACAGDLQEDLGGAKAPEFDGGASAQEASTPLPDGATPLTPVGAADAGADSAILAERDAGADASACATVPTHRFDTAIQKDIDDFTCSSTGCHGSAAGGFSLTKGATGAALTANYDAFKLRAGAGAASKVLTKGTGEVVHGGGTKFAKGDDIYKRWMTWILECNPR